MSLFTNITYYLLTTKKNITQYYNFIYETITNTHNVHMIHNNKPKKILLNYYFVYLITKIIKMLQCIRKYFDVNTTKIQMTKVFDGQNQIYIIDSKKYERSISLTDLLEYEDKFIKDSTLYGLILKFDVHDGPCLKKYILLYKDTKEIFDNTIGNILEFNDIELRDTDKIVIKMRVNNKFVEKSYCYGDVVMMHLNSFIKME